MLRLAVPYLADLLSEEVIGQRNAVETILTAVCENLEAYMQGRPRKLNNILLMGPTGSGKTQIARTIKKVIDIPLVTVTMADYTLTGYRGRDVQEIVTVDFYNAINSDQYGKIKKIIKRYRLATSVLELLKKEENPSVKFRVAAEFAALFVLLGVVKAERLTKRRYKDSYVLTELIEQMKIMFKELEDVHISSQTNNIRLENFRQKPFGIVFIDEIDKILIKERDDDISFYRPIQEFILTMIEGAKVTADEGSPIDTSHVTFILAGAFSEHSPDEFIPELKGRLNIKVKLRKLTYKEYLKIIKKKGINIDKLFEGFLVKVEESALNTLAEICERLNEKKYIGARRIDELLSKVNQVLNLEIQNSNSFPIVVDRSFVEWAINFEIPEESVYPHDEELADTLKNEDIDKELHLLIPPEKKNERKDSDLQDLQFKWLLEHYKKLLTKEHYTLNRCSSDDHNFHLLFKTNSAGKTIIEVLKEENYIREIDPETAKLLIDYIDNHIEAEKKEIVAESENQTQEIINDFEKVAREILEEEKYKDGEIPF